MMTKKLPPIDHEMAVMTRISQMLATLPPPGRRRVLAYVCARADSLPVIAAVGGGTEDDQPAQLFDQGDDDHVPMMPALAGAQS
jgi:hypothetical protein